MIIAGVCLLILGILFFKNKAEYLIRILLRGVIGTALIYGVNQVLTYIGIETLVGVNPVTVLTSMILGIPGVCALYFMLFL